MRHDSTAAQRSVLASTTIGQLCGWEGHMNESTKASYRKLAGNFYRSRLAGQIPTPKLITDGLIAAAPHYRPAYWRRLRNALEFDQRERGYPEAAERIRRTVNPVTKQGSQLPVKPKQRREFRRNHYCNTDWCTTSRAAVGTYRRRPDQDPGSKEIARREARYGSLTGAE